MMGLLKSFTPRMKILQGEEEEISHMNAQVAGTTAQFVTSIAPRASERSYIWSSASSNYQDVMEGGGAGKKEVNFVTFKKIAFLKLKIPLKSARFLNFTCSKTYVKKIQMLMTFSSSTIPENWKCFVIYEHGFSFLKILTYRLKKRK